MKVALIGATGFVGSRILNETLDRDHEVTAVVRRPERLPIRPNLTGQKLDVLEGEALAGLLAGHDAVISAYSADPDAADKYEAMVAGAKAIIAAAKKAGVRRLLVVGGAGSLEIAPGQQIIDQPGFPEEWKPGALGTREFLYLLREKPDLDWTFLSPAQMLQPGARTGEFRLGGDQVMVDAEDQCRISVEDYAVAMIDELEEPRHIRQRFCVAY
jgi:putative NADH-flavin reductase